MQSRQEFYTLITIPHVSRNTILSLLCTVMLATSPAHRLSSNSVMSSGRSFTLAPATVTEYPEKKPAEESEDEQAKTEKAVPEWSFPVPPILYFTYLLFSLLDGSKTVVANTGCCHSLPRFIAIYFNLLRAGDSCHGTQIRFSSSVISLPKSRVLPRFAAICRAEIVVNNL